MLSAERDDLRAQLAKTRAELQLVKQHGEKLQEALNTTWFEQARLSVLESQVQNLCKERDKIQQGLGQLKIRYADLECRLAEAEVALTAAKAENHELHNQLVSAQEQALTSGAATGSLKDRIEELEDQLQRLKQQNAEQVNKNLRLSTDLTSTRKRLYEIESEVKMLRELCPQTHQEKAALSTPNGG